MRLDIERHREVTERAWRLVDGGDDEQISHALTARAWQAVFDGDRANGIALARRGAGIVGAHEELSGGAILLEVSECLTFLEEYALAGQLLERALPVYRNRGMLVALIAALTVLSGRELRRGRFERAIAAATESVERAKEHDLSHHLAWALVSLAEVEAVLGRVDDCRTHAAEAVAATRASADREIEADAHDALGRLELGAGNAGESIAHFERAREFAGTVGRGIPYLRWRPDLIEAYVRAKRHAEAAAELATFESFEDTGLGPWATAAVARCRALLADEDALDDAFATALERCTDSVSPFERARTELVYGERLRRAGRRRDSREQLRAALKQFERLGASSWAERARGVPRQRRDGAQA
jgi:tetratricopeptide (TPR) repeat protein